MSARWVRLPSMLRRTILVVALIGLWQAYVSIAHVSAFLFSSPIDVARALLADLQNGSLENVTYHTLSTLLVGITIGSLLGVLMAALAVLTPVGQDLLRVLTSVFNPLPAIAVLPLAMLWFGLTPRSIIFVVALATIWPVAINTESGFRTLSATLRMVAQNLGLHGPRLVIDVLLPGALPQIITGAKTAWAFGWRTVVAAELVFGVAGAAGGLGWYIGNARVFMQTSSIFAGLVVISVLGLLIEGFFGLIEASTVVRWGMSQATDAPRAQTGKTAIEAAGTA